MVAEARGEQQARPGRRPSLNADHTAALRAIALEQLRSSLDEMTRELFRRAGVKVSTVTVRKALRAAGIERLKPVRRAGERAAVQGAAPKRCGYTAAHRRADGASGINTDLRDAEWALVSDLFERAGQRGAPARYERRHMAHHDRSNWAPTNVGLVGRGAYSRDQTGNVDQFVYTLSGAYDPITPGRDNLR